MTGVLTAAETSDLVLVHEQERAGLDSYTLLASRYPSQPVFSNLASSQKTQLATVTGMMDRYHVTDPSAHLAAGSYSDATVQQLYSTMVASGTSANQALDAIESFEQHHLTSLQAAHSHTTRTDLVAMYGNLEQASTSHISACNDALGSHAAGCDAGQAGCH